MSVEATRQRAWSMPLLLRMLVPYLAVAVFWYRGQDAWATILCYHGLIALFLAVDRPKLRQGDLKGMIVALGIGACLLAGPAAFLMFPFMTQIAVPDWLSAHGLADKSWLLMVPYFGLVHPFIEQAHWSRLREQSCLAHPAFAGYHMMVLSGLLTPRWLMACFAILFGASLIWKHLVNRQGGILAAASMHVAADLGIALAAFLKYRD